jgi:hypothetical protein
MALWFSKWIIRNPYIIASVIFMILAVFGWRVLDWGERQLGFLLLLYFIMTLGIRLDEISRAIGGSAADSRPAGRDPESLAAQLKEIRLRLRRIQASLDKLPYRDDSPDERQKP